MKLRKVFIVFCFLAVTAFAAFSLSQCGGGGGGTTPTTNCGVTLTSQDFPSDGVCANCDVSVTSATLKNFLATITSMTLLHKEYTADSDIPFICGKQGVWDPTVAGAFDNKDTVLNMTDNLYGATSPVGILEMNGVFICNVGFGFTSGATEGFHGATVWRGEITFTDGVTTYRARLRFTVTGIGADQTLASLGLNKSDIRLQDGNGNPLNTASDIRDLFAADPTNITVNVLVGSTTYLTATGGMICVETQ